MPGEVDLTLRGPRGYEVARAAIEQMERAKVWPTALNFELWLHLVADPAGALAVELQRLLSSGEQITDFLAEDLAHTFLPKVRLHDQIRDAGDQLSQELATVSRAIQNAQQTNEAYGQQLAGATQELSEDIASGELKSLVKGLASATNRAQSQNRELEQRLAESTAEVGRLRDHLIQVRRDATTDGLTNLANRKSFDEELERACSDADAVGVSVHLAVLDIDHFKKFNDTWGHQTGDQVIRFVASVIGRVGAPPRFAARYGGEEFAMIFPGESSGQVLSLLQDVLEEVASRVLRRRSTNEELGSITVSIGLAELKPSETLADFIERADAALYASKRTGRNRLTNAGKSLVKAA
jgi:diguanylate cyclase